MKVTTGSVDDWPALGIAVVIEGDADAVKSARIVASAATEKATRLKSAEAVLNGNRIDDKLVRRAADAAVEEAEFVSDVRGSVPYKRELMRVYVRRAVRAALDSSGSILMATIEKPDAATKVGSQIGRSVSRTEGRDKVTGRAEYVHTMRLPGMLVAKLFRSTVAHGRIKSIDTSAAKKVPGVLHVVTIDDVKKVIPNPYYGPAFHDQPILADKKVRFVGEPVAAVIASDPHIAEEAVQLITAEYEELPAVFDEVEALTSPVYVHDELRPAATFADLKHLKGVKNTNLALGYKLRRGDFDSRLRGGSPQIRARISHPEGASPVIRAARHHRRLQGHRRHALYRLARPVVRANRDRAPARLAGKQGPHQGALSRQRLWFASFTSSSRRWRWRCP